VKKKNDQIDAGKIADCLRCDFLLECHMASTELRDRRRTLRYAAMPAKYWGSKIGVELPSASFLSISVSSKTD
jgi:hypothetical protein